MIADTITQNIGKALKAGDEIRLSTLRLLSSALNYEKIAKQHTLTEEEEMAVTRRETKKRKEAIEAYEKAGNTERAEREAEELKILQEFLPEEMADDELNSLVEEAVRETGATTMADMGRVIGSVMGKAGGRAEGAKVAALVKQKLA